MNQQAVNDRIALAIGNATIRAIVAEQRADEAEAALAAQPAEAAPKPAD